MWAPQNLRVVQVALEVQAAVTHPVRVVTAATAATAGLSLLWLYQVQFRIQSDRLVQRVRTALRLLAALAAQAALARLRSDRFLIIPPQSKIKPDAHHRAEQLRHRNTSR